MPFEYDLMEQTQPLSQPSGSRVTEDAVPSSHVSFMENVTLTEGSVGFDAAFGQPPKPFVTTPSGLPHSASTQGLDYPWFGTNLGIVDSFQSPNTLNWSYNEGFLHGQAYARQQALEQAPHASMNISTSNASCNQNATIVTPIDWQTHPMVPPLIYSTAGTFVREGTAHQPGDSLRDESVVAIPRALNVIQSTLHANDSSSGLVDETTASSDSRYPRQDGGMSEFHNDAGHTLAGCGLSAASPEKDCLPSPPPIPSRHWSRPEADIEPVVSKGSKSPGQDRDNQSVASTGCKVTEFPVGAFVKTSCSDHGSATFQPVDAVAEAYKEHTGIRKDSLGKNTLRSILPKRTRDTEDGVDKHSNKKRVIERAEWKPSTTNPPRFRIEKVRFSPSTKSGEEGIQIYWSKHGRCWKKMGAFVHNMSDQDLREMFTTNNIECLVGTVREHLRFCLTAEEDRFEGFVNQKLQTSAMRSASSAWKTSIKATAVLEVLKHGNDCQRVPCSLERL